MKIRKILFSSILASMLINHTSFATQHINVASLKPMFDAKTWMSHDTGDIITIESLMRSFTFSVQIAVDYYYYNDQKSSSIIVKNCSPETPTIEVNPGSSIICQLTHQSPISFRSSSNQNAAAGSYQIQ